MTRPIDDPKTRRAFSRLVNRAERHKPISHFETALAEGAFVHFPILASSTAVRPAPFGSSLRRCFHARRRQHCRSKSFAGDRDRRQR